MGDSAMSPARDGGGDVVRELSAERDVAARDRLLRSAIVEFGTKGPHGTSTRDLARRAGTAMSAITYHYGGKADMYHAAAAHLANELGEELAPLVRDRVFPSNPADARRLVRELLLRLVDLMSDAVPGRALFIRREQLEPSFAFDVMYDGFMGPVLRTLVDLIQVVTGRDEHGCRIAALTMLGQIQSVGLLRFALPHARGRCGLDAGDVAAYGRRIIANVDAILDDLTSDALRASARPKGA